MLYKVVDRRALGGASVFGSPLAAPRREASRAPAVLGQAAQSAINATQLRYDKAKALYERIRVNYPTLAAIMGKHKADQAVHEAQAATDAAARAHNDSLEVAK
jgi:hypothetical protein